MQIFSRDSPNFIVEFQVPNPTHTRRAEPSPTTNDASSLFRIRKLEIFSRFVFFLFFLFSFLILILVLISRGLHVCSMTQPDQSGKYCRACRAERGKIDVAREKEEEMCVCVCV